VPSAECRVPSAWLVGLVCAWLMLLGVRSEASALAPPAAVKNLAAWYDASDATTFTTATAVTAMTDKSGNAETLTTTADPEYVSNGINGLGSLFFNGANQYLVSTDTNFSRFLLPTSTLFVVANPTNTANYGAAVASNGTGSVYYDLFLSYHGKEYFNFGDCCGNVIGPSVNFTGPHLWTGIGTESGPIFLDKDGTTVGSKTSTYGGETIACSWYVGAVGTCSGGAATGNYYQGFLGEVIVYNVALSQANQQLVEGILACKWGLQNQLPSSHPYYSTCPTGTESANLNGISGLSAWYDASDQATLSTTPTTTVIAWNDKSGNGENLGNAIGAQPTYTASSINGLGSMTFDGSLEYLFSNDADFSRLLSPASTLLVVAKVSSVNNGGSMLWSGTTTTSPQQDDVFAQNVFILGSWPTNSLGVSTALTGASLWVGIGDENAKTQFFRANGATIGSRTSSLTTAFACPLVLGLRVDCVNQANQYITFQWPGSLGEVLVYNRALSPTEYQFAEGYLACKWGLQSSLPSTHPYYSTCPATATPNLTLVAAVSPTGNQPPGTVLTYTTTYTNNSGTIAYNPTFSAAIPAHTDFQVGSLTSNAGSTGLSYTASYSSDGGSTWTYTPTSGAGGAASGYDRTVTNIRWTLSGALAPGSGVNSGTVGFTIKIQ